MLSRPVGLSSAGCTIACGSKLVPVWSVISAKVVTCRCIQQAFICTSCIGVSCSSVMASMRCTSNWRMEGIVHPLSTICILCACSVRLMRDNQQSGIHEHGRVSSKMGSERPAQSWYVQIRMVRAWPSCVFARRWRRRIMSCCVSISC